MHHTSAGPLLDPARALDLRALGYDAWLDDLPVLVSALQGFWELEDLRPLRGGLGGAVLACTSEGRPAVLKVALDPAALEREVSALGSLGALSAPLVFDYDALSGAALVERLVPGTPLDSASTGELHLEDLMAASILLDRLHRTAPPAGSVSVWTHWEHLISSEADRLSSLGTAPDERYEDLAIAGERFSQLRAISGEVLHLHGDAHPGNFLQGSQGVRIIDPDGAAGDPEVDFARLVTVQSELVPAPPDTLLEHICTAFGRSPLRATGWSRLIAWAHANDLEDLGGGLYEAAVAQLRGHARSPWCG